MNERQIDNKSITYQMKKKNINYTKQDLHHN
jgi:hypothetical protein